MLSIPSEKIEVGVNDRVLEVRLANPPDNRLTAGMMAGVDAALDRLEGDDVDVLLLTGGPRVFSKGFDVDGSLPQGASHGDLCRSLTHTNSVCSRLVHAPKLTIAAIAGACLGGGLELALSCHFRVCAEKARLGLPEVWINLVPGLGGFCRRCGGVGHAKALELVTLGDLVSAEEAFRLNLVIRVFPRDRFEECVGSLRPRRAAGRPARGCRRGA